jgi:hypothetical protein
VAKIEQSAVYSLQLAQKTLFLLNSQQFTAGGVPLYSWQKKPYFIVKNGNQDQNDPS